MKRTQPIAHKKKFGQHFLRWQHIVDEMIHSVKLNTKSSVMEIGCGDGFLTQSIMRQDIARLWVYEIDPEWAAYVGDKIRDERLRIIQEDVLRRNFTELESYAPWILLANLPYQITFPILFKVQQYRHLFAEGVVMVQEEVAEKILKTTGRGYGYTSLFFQHYFDWKKLSKIPPQVFEPSPKIHSRLLYFKPKKELVEIPHEQEFWKFIKLAFHQPRRTLKNNLAQAHYDLDKIPNGMLLLRAQQMTMTDLLKLWNSLQGT